jgi:uncharacterized membrane protein
MAELAARRPSPVAGGTAAIYRFLFPVPIVCFAGALASDIRYGLSEYLMWLHFSEWLITAGIVVGVIAALVLLVEFIADRSIRLALGWWHLALFYACIAVEIVNAFFHTIDGWTAVMWSGMILSALGALLALAAAATLRAVPPARRWIVERTGELP